jgi:type II secretory pathway component PulF
MLGTSFYNKYWNFDNTKFVKLLEVARKKSLLNKKSGTFGGAKEINLFSSVSKKDLWMFINKLSIFLNSWVDIKWALWVIVKQIKNPKLKSIAIEIKNNIDHGIWINESMSNYPKIFDPLTISLIKVWEKTWQLWKILKELDENLLENIELKAKVKWAMIYPMVLFSLTIIMVIFMMIFIVPRVTETFTKTWTALPWLTQFIVDVSDFLKNDYPYIILWLIWMAILFKMVNATYTWRMAIANTMTKLPIFWYVVKQSNIIYFIKSFTLLLDSWVLLLDSLKSASDVVPNLAYKKELIKIKNEVEVWLTISKSLWLNIDYETSIYLNKLFPEDFAYVVNTWEETWSLSESLKKIWANYNWELKRYIWNLSAMMEPIIIVVVWILVWTIIVWIMLPFFEMWKIAKKM